METIEIKAPRGKYLLLLLIAAALAGLNGYLLASGDSDWKLWGGLTFFGAMVLVFGSKLLRNENRLVISEDGIWDEGFGIDVIPWTAIEGAHLKTLSKNDFLCLELSNTDHYLQRANAFRQASLNANLRLGLTPFSVNLTGTNIDSNGVLKMVNERIANEQ